MLSAFDHLISSLYGSFRDLDFIRNKTSFEFSTKVTKA
jgi:hypothetical protein